MSLILSIETATNVCSVALHENGVLVAASEVTINQSHSELLALFIERVMNSLKIELKDLDAVAVSKGPGSYTGLRIGLSTAKGICYAHDKPLIAVCTLKAMVYELSYTIGMNDLIAPMIDARRMEVYTLLADQDRNIIKPVSALVVDANAYLEYLDERKIIFIGNGSDKCRQVITHSNARFLSFNYTSARNIGYIAHEKLQQSDFEDLIYFEPFYLKEYKTRKPKPL